MSEHAEVSDDTGVEAQADAGADTAESQGAPTEAPRAKKRRASVDWRSFVRDNARLLITFAVLAAGVVFVILGWYGAAHTNILTEQIPYLISGGLLGLGLIIVAGVMAAGAAQERTTDALRREIAAALANVRVGTPDTGVRSDAFSSNGHSVYVVPGGRSFHIAGCPILEGKEGIKELQPAQAAEAGYVACKLCGD